MNNLQIFNNPEFGQVRTVEIEGVPWFVAKDIAIALGYSNPRDAVSKHIDPEDRADGVAICDSIGREQKPTLINESGVYALVFGSRLDSARRFKHWVTSEVLPSIRKTGTYNLPQTYTQALEQLLIQAKENEKLLEVNQEMKPKAEFFDAVAGSKTAIEMAAVAKVLDVKGVGRNKLFEILRDRKVLGHDNIPYQKYIDLGWFRTIEQKYSAGDETHIRIKTLVYQKGVNGIRKMLIGNGV